MTTPASNTPSVRDTYPALCLRVAGGERDAIWGDMLACALLKGHKGTCIFGNEAMLKQAQERSAYGGRAADGL